MKKIKRMFRIYSFFNLFIVLIYSTNSSYEQCSEFTIKEYENIVNIPFSVPKLNGFVSKRGYQAVIIKSDDKNIYIQCKTGNLFDYFKIDKNQSILIENISVSYRENFIKKIVKEGYNITSESKKYRSLTYSKGNYDITIMRTPLSFDTDYIINIAKGEVIQQTEQEVIKEESNHTAQHYAKKTSQNSLEINSYTNTTDIKFKKGDKINIKASGYITLGVFAGSTGPKGIDGYTDYSILKELRHGCLMASIGNNEWFAVGESSSFIADKDGYLGFMVNDGDPSNNSGSFIVEYGINKSLATVQTKPPVTTPIRTQSNEQTYTKPVTEPVKSSTPSMTDTEIRRYNETYDNTNEKNPLIIEVNNEIKAHEETRFLYYKLLHPLYRKSNEYKVGSQKYKTEIEKERTDKIEYELKYEQEKKIIEELKNKHAKIRSNEGKNSNSFKNNFSSNNHDTKKTEYIVDERDNYKYPTSVIYFNSWITFNSIYKINGSKCYDDKIQNCERFGRFYTQEQAKYACPKGWRLPKDTELINLIQPYGKISYSGSNSYYKQILGGFELESTSITYKNLVNDQKINFPNINLTEDEIKKGFRTMFWTSTITDSGRANAIYWNSEQNNGTGSVHFSDYPTNFYGFCRCIKN